ncbi:hypothetical protein ACFQY7_53885 [Actinomadura luteofluorescens]|uniref:hypothetical protein n=1 Tax=Actinomadura luteofluorescens TaxID=46163 RepID=UPI00363C1459
MRKDEHPDHPARDVGVVTGAETAPGAVVHAGIRPTGAHLVFADPPRRASSPSRPIGRAPQRRPRAARCTACEEGL